MHTQFPYRLLPSLQNPTREFPVAVKLHKPRDQDVSFLFGARAITSLGKKVGGGLVGANGLTGWIQVAADWTPR
jgi:hypothetical protein